MNRIILCGRLVRNPELKTTNTGTEVCNFTLAVDRRFKGQNGEKQTDFITCTSWQKTAAFIDRYFKKGDGMTVEGRLESRKYTDRDGNNRVAWEVICDNVEFPLSRTGQVQGDMQQAEPVQADADGFTPVPDEDLPF